VRLLGVRPLIPTVPPEIKKNLVRLVRHLAWLFGAVSVLGAADADGLVKAGLAAEAKQDAEGALVLFLQADAARSNDAFILQKISKQYSDLVFEQRDDTRKKELAEKALRYARRSVALEPNNAVYVTSVAICQGHLALVADTQTKVQLAHVMKDEIDHALQLDPNYAWAHHLLGRWHCEMVAVGPTLRFFARIFYGGLPAASLDEGIAHLKRATELEPSEPNHWIDLGFAYAQARRDSEARLCWQLGLSLPSRGRYDEPARQRARDALRRAR
jgi:tetratricopeptide (TPR) repeat protein